MFLVPTRTRLSSGALLCRSSALLPNQKDTYPQGNKGYKTTLLVGNTRQYRALYENKDTLSKGPHPTVLVFISKIIFGR